MTEPPPLEAWAACSFVLLGGALGCITAIWRYGLSGDFARRMVLIRNGFLVLAALALLVGIVLQALDLAR